MIADASQIILEVISLLLWLKNFSLALVLNQNIFCIMTCSAMSRWRAMLAVSNFERECLKIYNELIVRWMPLYYFSLRLQLVENLILVVSWFVHIYRYFPIFLYDTVLLHVTCANRKDNIVGRVTTIETHISSSECRIWLSKRSSFLIPVFQP